MMTIRTSQMMTSRSLICLLENQNGGKLQKLLIMNEKFYNCVKKLHATALFLTRLDRFKNHIFYERKRMKKLALFLTDVKKKSN
jgi:hypothetical protein